MQKILADGQNGIPVLISQLTETARTKYQIADYWGDTRSGDVAYVILTDLFTDADLHTFGMPGVPNWPTVMKGCDRTAQGFGMNISADTAGYRYNKHGGVLGICTKIKSIGTLQRSVFEYPRIEKSQVSKAIRLVDPGEPSDGVFEFAMGLWPTHRDGKRVAKVH